ncbi:SDR family oxidoreductase [Cognatishimia maritima]|uniref:2-keto-3-deoxy-L-fuconate dehydrogenase n=1 Tax=Cognatishimia maritima TaxID=870908 RepID=A0A1M5QXG8_9RHOB|nr:SDR family oxidoreductase [Cognatishimia maritima]SHH18450.1 2-keto-3-deoxy-L-fuconate dehydrogenase [Cognatishimia maritima]
MTGRLQGRLAVVTAAGQGIGRAVAERLRAEGAIVHATDLNANLLDGFDGPVSALDCTDPKAVQAYFSGFEKVDILAHCVGFVHQGTVEECSDEDWRRSVQITLDSAFYTCRAALPKMKDNGGNIVAIASVIGANRGFPRRAAYGATKAGLVGLIKSIACDYLPNGIRANAVSPGTVQSPSLDQRIADLAKTFGDEQKARDFFMDRQPTGRFGTPEEIAALCAYLVSDESALITGQNVAIDGGITI